MKDKRSLHLKVQEMCDCFVTADPLTEMTHIGSEPDKEEGALKWLALTILYGIEANAKKISICRSKDGNVSVLAKYRKSQLPSPGAEIGRKVFDVMRGITHLEGEEGKMPLAMGIRDSSIELNVELDEKDGSEIIELKFPK